MSAGGERRGGLTRRIEILEEAHTELKQGLDRVELTQSHVREVLDSRFGALSRGQDLLLAKFETLSSEMADPAKTPATRALQSELDMLKRAHEALDERSVALKTKADELVGALSFAKQSGFAAVLLALAAIVMSALQMWVH